MTTNETTAHSPADVRHAAAVLDAYMADTGQDDGRHVLRRFVLRLDHAIATLGELADDHWSAISDRYASIPESNSSTTPRI